MARSLPPGFRFYPTDEELVAYFLWRKVARRRVAEGVIGEIDIYKFEPADLPGLAILQSRDSEWFFFNAQDNKYLHGSRTNRTTTSGYWKATGKDRKISTCLCTGMKKTLIYYAGRAPHGERTDWVMHEYRLEEEFEKKMNCSKSYVLCRIRRKGGLGPRNGEQYGAPVLEPTNEEHEEGLTCYSLDESYVLPGVFLEREVGERVLEVPTIAINEAVEKTETREDFDSFLQTLLSFQEEEVQPVQGGVNEPTHAAPTSSLDLYSSDMDNLCAVLHPVDNEAVMLEDILHLVTGQVEEPGISDSLVLQELFPNQAPLDVDNLHSVGFLELADLEEPCHEHGSSLPSEFEYFQGLIFASDTGMEMPMSGGLDQELQQLKSSYAFGDRESVRVLQHLEACGMVNEQLALEVPLDSSQGLSIIDSIHSRLLTSDDGGGASGDLPSGFVLSSDQEEGFTDISPSSLAPSHSHSNRACVQSEEAQCADMSGVSLEVGGNRSEEIDCVSQEQTRMARGEYTSTNIHSGTPLEEPDSSVVSLSTSLSSPSSVARVISGFLGKINVLPASAAELPVELERCERIMKESSIRTATESKTGHSDLKHPSSPSISGSSLHFRVKLNPLLDMEEIARTPELGLQWSIAPAVSDQGPGRPSKSFTNGLSIFLFWITTSALIFFCMFRGFCRSTRSALV